MKTHALLIVTVIGLALAGCSTIPRGAHFNRGTPESLLDVSSEVVTVQVASEGSVNEAISYIEQDQPTRAELYCADGDTYCNAMEEALKVYGLEYERIPSPESTLQLVYERVVARDCEHRFIDNHINPYNFNHPAFGCSIASNMVQMVSDKRQFTSPALMDFPDADKAVRNYNTKYLNPANTAEDQDQETFKLENLNSN